MMRHARIRFVLQFLSLMTFVKPDRIENFSTAWNTFTADPHVSHAVYSMTILDGYTGSSLFEHAKDLGLAPASSLKTITAAAALHYLDRNYAYETVLQYSGELDTSTGFLDGYISIVGTGDPSLGSWRYDETTSADTIVKRWVEAVERAGIRRCRGVIGDASRWETNQTMIIDGWTWNDIGHWYGTGHSALNWRENEFTIDIQPGSSVNSPARVVQITNPPPRLRIINKLTTSSSSSDASLYFALDGSNVGYLYGTISLDAPANYSLRCAVPNSALYAADELTQALRAHGIEIEQEAVADTSEQSKLVVLDVYHSPPLSKLLVPFLRISINMYGEVLVKTIAHHLGHTSLVDAPHTILPSYVTSLLGDENVSSGVATTDGSGLSRSNRLSTHALARTLLAVQDQPWFLDVFYEAFPTINGLKMKSGTLMNTVAYAGYVREHSLVFSFMINNYHGEQDAEMKKKIWTLLDTFK